MDRRPPPHRPLWRRQPDPIPSRSRTPGWCRSRPHKSLAGWHRDRLRQFSQIRHQRVYIEHARWLRRETGERADPGASGAQEIGGLERVGVAGPKLLATGELDSADPLPGGTVWIEAD